MSNPPQRVALVTGASSGIGRASALALTRAGWTVVGTGRDQARLLALSEEIALTLTLDLRRADSVDMVAEAVIARFGGLDLLVNNAGFGHLAPWSETEPERVRELLEVHLVGPMELSRRLLPSLIERRGLIVNVSSVAGLRGFPEHSAYCAAKFAMAGWSEALGAELAGTGVSVVLFCPPATDTPFFAAAGRPDFRTERPDVALMNPEQVANALLLAVEQRPRRALIDRRSKLLQLIHTTAPGLLDRLRAHRASRSSP